MEETTQTITCSTLVAIRVATSILDFLLECEVTELKENLKEGHKKIRKAKVSSRQYSVEVAAHYHFPWWDNEVIVTTKFTLEKQEREWRIEPFSNVSITLEYDQVSHTFDLECNGSGAFNYKQIKSGDELEVIQGLNFFRHLLKGV